MIVVTLILMVITCGFAAYQALTRPKTFALMLLPLGLLSFGAETDGVGGIANLSAIWLLALIAICAMAIPKLSQAGVKRSPSETCYLLFFAWCTIETFRAPNLDFAIRNFLKLLYPFLSMLVVRRAIDSEAAGSTLIRWQIRATLALLAALYASWLLPAIFYPILSISWLGGALLDHAALIVMLSLATWKVTGRKPFLYMALLGILTCFLGVNRTTILAIAVGGSIFCALEFRKLSVFLLPGLYFLVGTVLLTVPAFRQKMFYDPDTVETGSTLSVSDVTSDKFNSNGRFNAWDVVLEQFFRPHPWVGSGLGATQHWFYSGGAKEAGLGELKIEHSEYIKLLSDTGIVGLALFLLICITAMVAAARAYRRAAEGPARIFAIAALTALPAFLTCMFSDNILLYVLPAAQFPFAFAAIADRLSTIEARQGLEKSKASRPWQSDFAALLPEREPRPPQIADPAPR